MKFFLDKNVRARLRQRAWAMLAVMTFAGIGLMLLASVMSWARENAGATARNNEFFTTSYAAEAATEKVLAAISQQYQNYGFSVVSENMSSYAQTIPTASDGSYWTNYNFSGGTASNQIIVTNTATSNSIVLGAPYTGLTMVANTYEIIANAQNKSSMYGIVSTVGQKIYLGTIPLFQFAIFYQDNMEICPGGSMTIGGAVHGNSNIYLQPQAPMTFTGNVSAVDQIVQGESPEDPSVRSPSTVTFDGFDLSGVDPLNLPVGTNTTGTVSNSSQNVYAILQLPTAGQTPTDSVGKNLLYNQSDMIIIISNNNTITVTSGADINGQATVISNSQWQNFLSTNGTFYDQRDSLNVNPLVLNVSNLVNWSATNNVLRPVLASLRGSANADVESIYIDDMRSTSNMVVTTNVGYTTNYTTNASWTTNGSIPGSLYANLVTNLTTASNSYPNFPGSYVPPVTTNTTVTTTSSHPSSGSYIGSITTNNGSPKTYTYYKIVGYTYYTISSYSYHTVTSATSTNTSYATNWPITSQPGIVLSNGAVLPPQGLSLATPDPAYIIGNWNIKTNFTGSSDAGTADTSYTHPSAIYADAITVLSGSWNPANSTAALTSRIATNDTVNSAFLTGNVPSNGVDYSGGVENFPRFLENWSGKTFWYNGSMVAMFASRIATAPWPGTGTVYNPPTRTWAFDNNFNNPNKQPPLTPQIISVDRNQWVLLPPHSTSF